VEVVVLAVVMVVGVAEEVVAVAVVEAFPVSVLVQVAEVRVVS
jgi:hypothetical protein